VAAQSKAYVGMDVSLDKWPHWINCNPYTSTTQILLMELHFGLKCAVVDSTYLLAHAIKPSSVRCKGCADVGQPFDYLLSVLPFI
jgi:hypothetical protein